MLFRNVVLFRLPEEAMTAFKATDLQEALSSALLRKPGPMEMSTKGVLPPFGEGHEELAVSSMGLVWLTPAESSRMLPSAVVKDEVNERARLIEEETGERPKRAKLKELKETVLNELLPKAFIRKRQTVVCVDTRAKEGWVLVATSSQKGAEDALTVLRSALGSFAAVPPAPNAPLRPVMTQWLMNGTLPDDLALGDSCDLKDPADPAGATIRARNQQLDCDEVRDHLRKGKQVTRLGLIYKEAISFQLGEDFGLRSIKIEDISGGQDNPPPDSAEDAALGDFLVEATALLELADAAKAWFEVE